MTNIRIALSDAAFAKLTDFCAANLKPGLDPERYAAALAAEADLGTPGEYLALEIRAIDSANGNPATIGFEADTDFDHEGIE